CFAKARSRRTIRRESEQGVEHPPKIHLGREGKEEIRSRQEGNTKGPEETRARACHLFHVRDRGRSGTRGASECVGRRRPVSAFVTHESRPRCTVIRCVAALLSIAWLAASAPSE